MDKLTDDFIIIYEDMDIKRLCRVTRSMRLKDKVKVWVTFLESRGVPIRKDG
jgi:hypothetical protein